MKKTLFTLLNLCFGLMIASPALAADDAALYAPEPPENAAFIRVINGTAKNLDALPMGGVNFNNVAAHSISAYQIVPEGSYPSPKNAATTWVVAPKKYYVLTMTDKATSLVEESGIENPAKSQVYFYNLTSKAGATLFAPKHNVDIVSSVAAGGQSIKPINALTLDISARIAGKEVELFQAVELQRRIGTTFVIAENGAGAFTAFYATNQQAQ